MFSHLIADYGSFIVAVMLGFECLGLPLPGEAVLIAAAIYAGHTHDLSIANVVGAATLGAILGNVGGYLLGRMVGYPLLIRYGRYIALTDGRIKIGRYLFREHGVKAIVAARFVAVLRSVGGILAGANQMPWPSFLLATIIGAIVWTVLYGLGAYYLGDHIHFLTAPAGVALAVLAVLAIYLGSRMLAHRERQLQDAAERAFPGPLTE